MSARPLARVVTVNGSDLLDGGLLFDKRALEVGKFRLGARSAVPIGRPSLSGWTAALEFACATHEASPYWIGDLMAYSESRQDWQEKLSQAMEVSGLAEQTLQNLGYISRHVEEHERRLAPTLAHAAEVAALERPEQTEWLEQARSQGWTVRDLRLNIRASRRRRLIDGQAALEGMFRVIYADPSWLYDDRPPSGSGAIDHYPCLTIEQLCKLPVAAHAMPNSVLFCWATAPILLQNPGPREVIEAWGFTPKTQRIWDKVDHGWGHYWSVRHEILILATRGSCTPDRPTPMLDSVVAERAAGDHSSKPESFRKDIERLYDGPYLELFGRRPVEGWSVFGNDARLWAQQAEATDEHKAESGAVRLLPETRA